MLVQGAVFWYFGLYRGVWRFASIPDLLRIGKAVAVGVCLIALGLFLLTRMQDVPRSVLPAVRGAAADAARGSSPAVPLAQGSRPSDAAGARRWSSGAGDAGEMLVRDLLRNPEFGCVPVGFVDDDLERRGARSTGCGCSASAKLPKPGRAQRATSSCSRSRSATSRQMRRIVELCEQAGVPMKTLPGLGDLPSGRASLMRCARSRSRICSGASPCRWTGRRSAPASPGRTVLVTGGGGSIGAELCRQLARLGPGAAGDRRRLRVQPVRSSASCAPPSRTCGACPCSATCAMRAAWSACSRAFRPALVLHAAAYKHVPMLEQQVRQAVRNNVFGTRTAAPPRCAMAARPSC
jgi:FlaA1/EpsC-like NDP-sugar epimerase